MFFSTFNPFLVCQFVPKNGRGPCDCKLLSLFSLFIGWFEIFQSGYEYVLHCSFREIPALIASVITLACTCSFRDSIAHSKFAVYFSRKRLKFYVSETPCSTYSEILQEVENELAIAPSAGSYNKSFNLSCKHSCQFLFVLLDFFLIKRSSYTSWEHVLVSNAFIVCSLPLTSIAASFGCVWTIGCSHD